MMKEEEPTAFSDAASATGLMWECIDVNEPEYGIYRHDDPDPVAVLSSVDDAERYIIEQAELAWRRVESDTLREANASLRRKLAPNQDCEGQGCQANALMVALRAAEEALAYIAQPSMAWDGVTDPEQFVSQASEANVRLALQTCIRIARTALQQEGI